MKRILASALLGVLVAGTVAKAQVGGDVAGPPTLATFTEEVAVFRRVIRQYCAIVQRMMAEKELDVAKQQQGLDLLAKTRPLWVAIQETYADRPPLEYAADRAFKMRLRDIDNARDDMQRALQAGDARRSMLACGFACGLFVRMHEENGISFALDKLFHLRADIRTTTAAFRTRGMEAVRERLSGLLQKRDVVLFAPLPFPADHAQAAAYTSAVEELSRELDRLAMAAAAGDMKQVEEILSKGVPLVNKPYGIAL